jgi:hypothetical protein
LRLGFEHFESIRAAGNSIRAIIVIPLLPSICQRNHHKSRIKNNSNQEHFTHLPSICSTTSSSSPSFLFWWHLSQEISSSLVNATRVTTCDRALTGTDDGVTHVTSRGFDCSSYSSTAIIPPTGDHVRYLQPVNNLRLFLTYLIIAPTTSTLPPLLEYHSHLLQSLPQRPQSRQQFHHGLRLHAILLSRPSSAPPAGVQASKLRPSSFHHQQA